MKSSHMFVLAIIIMFGYAVTHELSALKPLAPAATPAPLAPAVLYAGDILSHFSDGALLIRCPAQLQPGYGPAGLYVLVNHPLTRKLADGTRSMRFYARSGGQTTYTATDGSHRAVPELVYAVDGERMQRVASRLNPLEHGAYHERTVFPNGFYINGN